MGLQPCAHLLALRAVVGASPAKNNPLDRRPARSAGFAGLGVDAVEMLEAAGLAGDVDVVAEGAAALAEGASQGRFSSRTLGRPRGPAASKGARVKCPSGIVACTSRN